MSAHTAPRSGQAMVEFALTMVPFLMFILAIFEGGRMIATNYAIANAAREGARAGRYLTVTSNDVALAAANVTASTFTGQLTTVTQAPNSSCGANQVCVCRHILPSASLSASCDTTGLTKGSVVDVTLNYTFQFVPLMNNNTYFCLFCRASLPMSAYYRVAME
jgi:Flp pilus assembly protein TadG